MIRPSAVGSIPISETCRRITVSISLPGKASSNSEALNSASASARFACDGLMPSDFFRTRGSVSSHIDSVSRRNRSQLAPNVPSDIPVTASNDAL